MVFCVFHFISAIFQLYMTARLNGDGRLGQLKRTDPRPWICVWEPYQLKWVLGREVKWCYACGQRSPAV